MLYLPGSVHPHWQYMEAVAGKGAIYNFSYDSFLDLKVYFLYWGNPLCPPHANRQPIIIERAATGDCPYIQDPELNSRLPRFASSNPYNLLQVRYKYLSITNFACIGRVYNCFNSLCRIFFSYSNL